jgi:uncharacterized SAM-binding protein YcdF (DUF218 family)
VTRPSPVANPPHADAIVVLGCGLHGDAASPALVRRVERGVALFRDGAAPLLLLSGGGGGARPEADAMHEVAVAHGMPAAAILLEPSSRNTHENAVGSARLLRDRGLGTVILVSDGYHLRRARRLFRGAGLDVVATAHPPNRGLVRELPLHLREIAATGLGLARLLRRGRAAQ